ncbi:penicillin-binding protein 2 [Candidatus Methylacidiphilum fumarolicum]|uniref:Beta-lactamase n=2 Tax=Candidatus Methylacidiphilum fumarolicum TaxID=591154 RepID=I0JXP0_METFB|nr:penicillin-binding protein 2 [Candidatus Methylacidiphilum fumarolicum]MBW6415382.1 penicillin-binding protein 2 [Candidatus Methylacidiphilum fumarolicum]TFE69153.1 penicillin-binding protein 2 [Candidatus Methylacidiphilum fumarolicum]TFE72795.1 penicillin-binding protein 2 [Candidatus Methylacidiphilum fumarolicum]TFE74668.1 penicillin-binding protein 2 [Candidatus Methylacidiphilum fumarolicum]TFE77724.1 penicillin-binding protein 2 [Candidatus Methylacidiphilum fumarolicum]
MTSTPPGIRHSVRLRIALLALAVIIAMGILLTRLWILQIYEGKAYASKLRNQTTISLHLAGARGPILDKNGVGLAENRAMFEIDLYLDELVRDFPRRHKGKTPRIEVQRMMGGNVVLRKEPDIYKIVMTDLSPILKALRLAVKLDPKELQRHYFTSPSVPYSLRTDLDYATVARFEEQNLGVPGIDIAVKPIRYYNYGALASHVIGYVAAPDDKEKVSPDGIALDMVGKWGIERYMDGQLQGKPGGRILKVNYRGYIVNEESYIPPQLGDCVYLSLDTRIQYIVETALRSVGRGAAVVVDPNTGDILAMCSVPNFDPNDFIPKISQENWQKLTTDPTNPLVNRAISSYPPGSTFKLLISLAALKSGAITPKTVINSPAAIDIGGHLFHDWTKTGRGNITLYDGIRYSCNTFFYQVGIRTGIQNIEQMANVAGFGQLTGIPLPGESPGIVPGPEWMKQKYPMERWSTAHTANVSIGQGFLQVTPLQMALFVAAIANGGTLFYPRIVQGVSNNKGEIKIAVPSRVHSQLDVNPQDLEAVKSAMLGVVEEGTGANAKIEGIKVAGKTGSAQATKKLNNKLYKDTRAWFVGFAPYESPRYAFCILVEGGISGGATAAPIAKKILEGIFDIEKGHNPTLTYLKPAIGNFNGLTEFTKEQSGSSQPKPPPDNQSGQNDDDD